jgi:hypothetical protein
MHKKWSGYDYNNWIEGAIEIWECVLLRNEQYNVKSFMIWVTDAGVRTVQYIYKYLCWTETCVKRNNYSDLLLEFRYKQISFRPALLSYYFKCTTLSTAHRSPKYVTVKQITTSKPPQVISVYTYLQITESFNRRITLQSAIKVSRGLLNFTIDTTKFPTMRLNTRWNKCKFYMDCPVTEPGPPGCEVKCLSEFMSY